MNSCGHSRLRSIGGAFDRERAHHQDTADQKQRPAQHRRQIARPHLARGAECVTAADPERRASEHHKQNAGPEILRALDADHDAVTPGRRPQHTGPAVRRKRALPAHERSQSRELPRRLDFAGRLPASRRRECVKSLDVAIVIPFPTFDPVLISIGPLAIRWYALAYIVGILLGWLYARALIRVGAAVGRAGAADRRRLRRLRAVGDARHHPRRPHRLCAVLQSALFRRASGGDLQLWKGGMSFHGGFLGCVLAVVAVRALPRHLDPVARRHHLRGGDRSGCSSAASPISSMASCGAAPTDVPWAMVFPGGGPLPRHPSQLYEAALEGLVLFVVLGAADARRRAQAARASSSAPSALGYGIARSICEFFREPDAQLGFLWGGLTMGMLLSLPLMLAGIALIVAARCDASRCGGADGRDERPPAGSRNPPAHRGRRSDAGRAIHGAVPHPSGARLLHHARSVRRRRATSSPRPRSARCSAS